MNRSSYITAMIIAVVSSVLITLGVVGLESDLLLGVGIWVAFLFLLFVIFEAVYRVVREFKSAINSAARYIVEELKKN